MSETWKDIPGYEGDYQVSDMGNVRSLDRVVFQANGCRKRKGQLLKPSTVSGYLHVVLGRQHSYLIHSLVAAAFIGPRPAGCDVRHGPGGKLDNRAVNLSYGTRSENNNDRWRDGTMKYIGVVRGDGKAYRCLSDVKEDGFHIGNVCMACQGKYKTSGGYTWRYT